MHATVAVVNVVGVAFVDIDAIAPSERQQRHSRVGG
jgi:hypothetical protein